MTHKHSYILLIMFLLMFGGLTAWWFTAAPETAAPGTESEATRPAAGQQNRITDVDRTSDTVQAINETLDVIRIEDIDADFGPIDADIRNL